MKTVNLGESHSVLNSFIAELRDASIQKDRLRFRTNLERVGQVFALELSKVFAYSPKQVTTPLGIATVETCDTPVVIASILRAALPLQKGFLDFFDKAESAFLATYRKYGKGDYFELRVDYCSTPSLEGKALVVADTLIATGAAMEVCVDKLIEEGGEPASVHIIAPIASSYAADQLAIRYGDNVNLWVAAIDEELTGRSYIIPGIGDAGDLAFGEKI